MAEIIPAILPQSYDELEEKLGLIAAHAPSVQIDVCDGAFVPSRTWPYLRGPGSEDAIFSDIVSQEKALPHWEDTDFEFDLMVKGAGEKMADFISAGASRVIVHEASVMDAELESIVREYGKRSEELGPFDIELGLGIGNDARPELIARHLDKIHFVQIMGIDKIGFQGQSFNERTVDLVRALRQAHPELIISIDGGVNLETGKRLVEAGASRLVVGSALFSSEDLLGTLESFRNL